MLSVSILLISAAASQADPEALLLRARTAKSLDAFGSCFTQVQDRRARPWAFMPSQTGGIFTDAGATAASAPYWLAISDAQIRLFGVRGSYKSRNLAKAVKQCS